MSEKGEFIDLLTKLAERIEKERETMSRMSNGEPRLILAVEHLTDTIMMAVMCTETHRAMERVANPEKFGL